MLDVNEGKNLNFQNVINTETYLCLVWDVEYTQVKML